MGASQKPLYRRGRKVKGTFRDFRRALHRIRVGGAGGAAVLAAVEGSILPPPVSDYARG